MTKQQINSTVNITSVGFGRNMQSFPRVMSWAGRTYQFIDKGICITSRRGEQVTTTMTMSDGINDFCLRHTSGLWTLVSIY